jgi:hypothetical protein
MTIDVSPAVADALAAGRPVVALETTILCHGIPRPRNRELAAAIEDAVRAAGAIPATTAVIDGRIRIGLATAELEQLLAAAEVAKCSTPRPARHSDERRARLGATTVAATMFVAARIGIRIMATGGIGGVHQGGERTLDLSADLGCPDNRRNHLTLILRPHVDERSGGRFHLDRFDAYLYGELILISRQPWYDGARALLSRGYPGNTLLTIRHANEDCDSFLPLEIG